MKPPWKPRLPGALAAAAEAAARANAPEATSASAEAASPPPDAASASTEAASAPPTSASAPLDAASPAAASPAPGPVNKLHEWGAALAIMALLTLILFSFLFFLRGVSL
ncbi:MAG: hypothetical protein KF894_29735 [Labilithrix sp.]|nr:hypothetical protein [Labilithrix sp.]